jgi:hypothetical protein
MRWEDLDPAFLAQDHVEFCGEIASEMVLVKIKHWAKKPYRVTRGSH